jgi:hypothetical protein
MLVRRTLHHNNTYMVMAGHDADAQRDNIGLITQSVVSSGHAAHVHCIAVEASGKFLATCSSDRRVNIFTRDDRHRRVFPSGDSPGGGYLDDSSDDDTCDTFGDPVSCDNSNDRSVWTHQIALDDLDGPVQKVAWIRHDRNIYLASAGGRRANIYMLGWQRGGATASVDPAAPPRLVATVIAQLDGHGDTISDIAFCPTSYADKDILMFACASLDGCVRFYLPAEGRKLAPRYGKICPAEDFAVAAATLPSPCGGAGWTVGWLSDVVTSATIDHMRPQYHRGCIAPVVTSNLSVAPSLGSPSTLQATTALPASHTAQTAPRNLPPPCGLTTIGWLPSTTAPYATFLTGTELGTVDAYLLTRRDHKAAYIPMALTAPAFFDDKSTTFSQLRLPGSITCIAWAPAVGRKFDLVAIGTRRGTAILRLKSVPNSAPALSSVSCVLTSSAEQQQQQHRTASPIVLVGEVFFAPWLPSVQASWDASGTVLTILNDEITDDPGEKVGGPSCGPSTLHKSRRSAAPPASSRGGLKVLHPTDWANHQSWVVVSL